MSIDLDDAWNDLHDAAPAGWYVGRPAYDEGRKAWEKYAFDPSERARAGASGSSRRQRRPARRPWSVVWYAHIGVWKPTPHPLWVAGW
jgi:hypothetical protein